MTSTPDEHPATHLTNQFKNALDELKNIIHTTKILKHLTKSIETEYKKQCRLYNKKKRKNVTKLHIPVTVKAPLAVFLNLKEPVISKRDAMVQIAAYVKENHLQCPEDKRRFIPDQPLMTLFGIDVPSSKLTFVEIHKYIIKYFK